MQFRELSDEDLKETLQRARVIAALSAPTAEQQAGSGLDAYLQASDEVGLPREAFLQALRERNVLPAREFTVGEKVFAPSADGFWYAAEVVRTAGMTSTVRFLSGSEHDCATADLRPLSLVPGRKVDGNLPGWGWYSVEVTRYDEAKGKVQTSDGMMSYKLDLGKLRLHRNQANPPTAGERRIAQLNRATLMRWAVVFGGGGVLLGVLLDRLLALVFH